jgi:hypothetical protein
MNVRVPEARVNDLTTELPKVKIYATKKRIKTEGMGG